MLRCSMRSPRIGAAEAVDAIAAEPRTSEVKRALRFINISFRPSGMQRAGQPKVTEIATRSGQDGCGFRRRAASSAGFADCKVILDSYERARYRGRMDRLRVKDVCARTGLSRQAI